jgi:lysophospholipase L1-like esterase
MTCFRTAVAIVFLGSMALSANAQKSFYLHEGDRVVFYGDSITDQRLYTVFTESYVVTRFPKMNVKFVHSGWGGDRVTGGGGGPIDLRLQRDVFPYNPTVVTIMLGMNDASYRPFDQGIFSTYTTGYQHIIDSLKSHVPGVRITAIQPSPFDDVTRAPNFEGGYNAVLVRYGDWIKGMASKEGLHLADLNTPVVAALEKAKSFDPPTVAGSKDPLPSQRLVPDRVHPGPGGHLLMAEALLRAWNAPAVVSAVEIDGAGKRAVSARNSRVTEVMGTTSGVTWVQLDNALPMPIDVSDAPTVLALRASDFLEALDQETVKVTGLAAARYSLKIDGEHVGTYSNDVLAQGINLAAVQTPMLKQAMDVHYLTRLHNDVHFTRWRQVQVPHGKDITPTLQKSMDALDRADDDIAKQQRAAAQTKPHRFELVAE